MSRIIRSVVVCVIAVPACSTPSEPDPTLDIGAVHGYFEDDPAIDAPDTVSVGEAFIVRVRTYGNGCNRAGPTETSLGPREALVIPYDFQGVGGPICEDYLNIMEHEASSWFTEPGAATITVRGRADQGRTLRDFPVSVWVR